MEFLEMVKNDDKRLIIFHAMINPVKLYETSRKYAKSLRKLYKHKNTYLEIDLTNYYDEIYLPNSFIIMAINSDAITPMYKNHIASLIIQRVNNNKFTVLPVVNIDYFEKLYGDTPLYKYAENFALIIEVR